MLAAHKSVSLLDAFLLDSMEYFEWILNFFSQEELPL